jgi:hypothetical protein
MLDLLPLGMTSHGQLAPRRVAIFSSVEKVCLLDAREPDWARPRAPGSSRSAPCVMPHLTARSPL